MKSEKLLELYLAQAGKSNVRCDHTDSDHLDFDAQSGHIDNDNHVDHN